MSVGERLAAAEKAAWGEIDPNQPAGKFGHSPGWYRASNEVRDLRIAEACAVLGISPDHAAAIHRQFAKQALRRADNFLDHAATVVREGASATASQPFHPQRTSK